VAPVEEKLCRARGCSIVKAHPHKSDRLLINALYKDPKRRIGFRNNLHECRGPPNPVLAVGLGDGFHIIYVGGRLSEDVVQVIPDTDKSEVLLKEFSDAPGSE
jgi:hypothetical protein